MVRVAGFESAAMVKVQMMGRTERMLSANGKTAEVIVFAMRDGEWEFHKVVEFSTPEDAMAAVMLAR